MNNVEGLDQQCSGGVYPRLNGGYRRCPPTNRLSEFIDDNRQAHGGDKPRHYDGGPIKQVKPTWPLGYFLSKSRLNLRQVSKPLHNL
jgi:hypothetical protein